MIVSFSVSNFRSFLGEETLSMVASKRLSGNHEEHTVSIPDSDEKGLRVAVLYGANGAGKSNLFKALRYVKSLVLEPREKSSGTGRERFRFAETANDPSQFDLQFIVAERLYRFGFNVNDERITEEWLLRVTGGRESVLYERVTDHMGRVTIESPGLKNAGEKLKALTMVGGPQNQLFLATVRATLDEPDQGEELRAILTWFEDDLKLVAPNASFRSLGRLLAQSSAFSDFAGSFLKSCSTGVDHLEVLKSEITEDELRTLLPESALSTALGVINEDEGHSVTFRLPDGKELVVEQTDATHYYRLTVQAAHEHLPGKVIPLELSEESDGTRRLLNLIPALHHLRTGTACYFIDEIDRSLHPILVWKFLDFFLKSCAGARRQIVVTTHESNLLDLDLVRRDEIWFAEKDERAATRLYSLADFKVRKDLEVRKHYLQGRFGAVPFLGELDRLLVEQSVKPNEPCPA